MEKERLEKILEHERIEKLRLEQEKYQHEKLKREIQNNKYLNGVIYKDIAERRGTIPAISKPIITKAQYIGGILQTPETFNMLVKYYDTVPECHYSIDVPEYRIEEDLEYICMIRSGDNNNYINFFFKSDKFEGEPRIIEKDNYI